MFTEISICSGNTSDANTYGQLIISEYTELILHLIVWMGPSHIHSVQAGSM